MSDTIWQRYHKIQKERMEKVRDYMKEYDKTIYHPLLKELEEECGNSPEGHLSTTYHDNGFGYEGFYCGKCGAQHSVNKYIEDLEEDE